MKTIRVLSLLSVLLVSATTIAAQPEATTSPSVQPAPSPQTSPAPTVAENKVMPEKDFKEVTDELDKKWNEYDSKGNWYLAFYYIFTIGAAVSGALAGLILQWEDTPQRSFKKAASILAFVGAALVTLLTYVDFTANARANKAAANQTIRLKLDVQRGSVNDPVDVREKMQDIFEQKQVLGLPKSPSAAPQR